MINRRRVLKAGAAAGAASLLPATWGEGARAQANRPFTFVSWGGALQETEKKAFIEPFFAKKGMKFAEASPTTYAKIKAQVEAKAIEWDLVTVGGQWMYQAKEQNLAEPMDYSVIKNDDLAKAWKAEFGVYTSTGATVVAFNTKAFPEGKRPKSWADFWNVKDFPGPRSLYARMHYNYEAALRAAGVPLDKIYPFTDEKVRTMFQKLEEIKPHVSVWWTSGAQAPQLLSTGEVALAMAWNGRILDAQKSNSPIAMTLKDAIAWGNAFIVPKGSPYKALAMEVINYAITEEAQDRLISIGTYGPVLEKSAAKATPQQALQLVTHPSNVKEAVIFNDQQSAGYLTKYEADWQKFQLKK
jgi:putative spermidine/putrescine transport system substrate-binding protein